MRRFSRRLDSFRRPQASNKRQSHSGNGELGVNPEKLLTRVFSSAVKSVNPSKYMPSCKNRAFSHHLDKRQSQSSGFDASLLKKPSYAPMISDRSQSFSFKGFLPKQQLIPGHLA
jgi:hypothetical protein